MGLLLAIISLIYPFVILKLFGFIHKRWRIRLYWLILPLCLSAGIAGPFLYEVAGDSNILFNLDVMIDFSIKTGAMMFLVIPSALSALVCTAYGYFKPLE